MIWLQARKWCEKELKKYDIKLYVKCDLVYSVDFRVCWLTIYYKPMQWNEDGQYVSTSGQKYKEDYVCGGYGLFKIIPARFYSDLGKKFIGIQSDDNFNGNQFELKLRVFFRWYEVTLAYTTTAN